MPVCKECGMQVGEDEFHPYAACLMYKRCFDAAVVRKYLQEVVAHGASQVESRIREQDLYESLALAGIHPNSLWEGIERLRERLAGLQIGHRRYEIVRTMNAEQFADAYLENISTGARFDDIIDRIGAVQSEHRVANMEPWLNSRQHGENGPTFDRDGDPTEETLRTIAGWEFNLGDTACFDGFLQYVRDAWNMDYGAIREEGGNLVFVTGGWSSNEDVMQAVMRNYMFRLLRWEYSSRGGATAFRMSAKAD